MSRTIPLVSLKGQHDSIRAELDRAIKEVLDANQFVLGESVESFEKEIGRFLGCKYALGVASGTDALLLSLAALGIGRGDEVITTPSTYFATVGAILHAGAKPVFVDIASDTYTINTSLIKRKISRKTKAILPVHLYGQCAGMDDILTIAKQYQLAVVEDCAQAFGAMREGKKAGTFGDLGAFSFYPTKNLGACGDGGLIVGDRETLMEKIRSLRAQGSRRDNKYIHDVVGYNSRLDSIQAAILKVKLKYINQWNQARREKANIYNRLLKDIREIQTPYVALGNTPIYHLYCIRAKKRDQLINFLEKNGIETGIYYPLPQHLQKAVPGYQRGDFPEAERASRETLTLPMFPELTEEEQEYITCSIRDFYAGGGIIPPVFHEGIKIDTHESIGITKRRPRKNEGSRHPSIEYKGRQLAGEKSSSKVLRGDEIQPVDKKESAGFV
jgi:dTDP-4-amino-4,6-dideoxygalactose transaminase